MKYVYLKPALDMTAAFWTPTFWIGLFNCILQANWMVLIKLEAKFTKKRSKSRDRNFFRFLALKVFFTIWLLKKGGADKPPPHI